jgi:hypothetical protein
MYITTRLSEVVSPATYKRPFSSAERDVTEKDAPHIFTILGGPSPWRQYLQSNLASHRRYLPSNPMRICDEREFADAYRRIFSEAPPADAQGFVDRRNARMILREFPAKNFGKTKVGLALHEAVHLFSHPPGKSNTLRATSYDLLGRGLIEGLTQMITDDILAEQKFSPLRADWQAFTSFTPVARKLVNTFSLGLVAEAFFYGNLEPLKRAIGIKWGSDGFANVRQLTNQKQKDVALRLIKRLNEPKIIQQVFR